MFRGITCAFAALIGTGCNGGRLVPTPSGAADASSDGGGAPLDGGSAELDGGGNALDGGPGGGRDGGLTSSLVGVTWNATVRVEELRAIDPNTGFTTLVAIRPEIDLLYDGVQTYDPGRNAIVLIGSSNLDHVLRVFSIDATSGALANKPALTLPGGAAATIYNWSGGIHVRADGTLVGVTWDSLTTAGSEELRTIDPSTGITQPVATVPGIAWVVDWASTYDGTTDSIFVGGNADGGSSVELLYRIDATTGSLIASPEVPHFWEALHVRSDHAVVGILWNGVGQPQLGTLDPTTGAATMIASIPGIDEILSAVDAYDSKLDVLYLVAKANADPTLRLFCIDGMTGAVLASPLIDPTGDAGAAYNWSGGLHVVN
jgi:hypothetical protein